MHRDGTHWSVDSRNKVTALAMELALMRLEQWQKADSNLSDLPKVNRLLQARGIKNMLELAKSVPQLVTDASQLDSDPWLLATPSELFDLRANRTVDDSRSAICTRTAAASVVHDAPCERWMQFIDVLTNGDSELAEFLQRAVGYSLTGDTREQCLFFLYGVGCNGKSTFISTLEKLFGSYAVRTPAKTLLDQRTDGIPNDLARLRGARFVVASEIPQGSRLNEARIKDLTGGDTVAARFLHKEFFDYRPNFKLWMYGNHLPQVNGSDLGIWRRFRCIPCDAVISSDRRDSQLLDKLSEELSGILNWALEGCLKWQEGGIGTAEAVERANSEYRQEMDHIERFLAQATVRSPGETVQASNLYEAYRTWCGEAGRSAISMTLFGRYLSGRDYPKKTKRNGRRHYEDICVRGQD